VLIVEEGQPNFLEQAVRAVMQEHNATATGWHGKTACRRPGIYRRGRAAAD